MQQYEEEQLALAARWSQPNREIHRRPVPRATNCARQPR
ncbi:Metal-dependent hydrolase involved in phosphonate metabolism [Escherichia coli ISC7]|uniref:Metal-dependent hydrolase involved in phosphonate metabolism n=1 Tax=Escherichia coli ISC7 TaxID=1432555 RepID=W1F5X8_ECOLX|nr:Metal-dependent hydrolase involved in phosphonate metabolism [Escherichia coli ISC7]